MEDEDMCDDDDMGGAPAAAPMQLAQLLAPQAQAQQLLAHAASQPFSAHSPMQVRPPLCVRPAPTRLSRS